MADGIIIGIDPGQKGAIAFLGSDFLHIEQMPEDKGAVLSCLNAWVKRAGIEHAWLENVTPFGMGRTSAFTFGHGIGMIEMALMSCNIPLSRVTAAKWKRTLGCPKDKTESICRASELLPAYSDWWRITGRASKDKAAGRAEAAMIALYGRQQIITADRDRATVHATATPEAALPTAMDGHSRHASRQDTKSCPTTIRA